MCILAFIGDPDTALAVASCLLDFLWLLSTNLAEVGAMMVVVAV